MTENKPDDGMWFAPKRYGYGSSFPVSWQGWTLTAGFLVAAITLGPVMMHEGRALRVATLVGFLVLLAAYIEISRRKTRGGWKWRWGGKE